MKQSLKHFSFSWLYSIQRPLSECNWFNFHLILQWSHHSLLTALIETLTHDIKPQVQPEETYFFIKPLKTSTVSSVFMCTQSWNRSWRTEDLCFPNSSLRVIWGCYVMSMSYNQSPMPPGAKSQRTAPNWCNSGCVFPPLKLQTPVCEQSPVYLHNRDLRPLTKLHLKPLPISTFSCMSLFHFHSTWHGDLNHQRFALHGITCSWKNCG